MSSLHKEIKSEVPMFGRPHKTFNFFIWQMLLEDVSDKAVGFVLWVFSRDI